MKVKTLIAEKIIKDIFQLDQATMENIFNQNPIIIFLFSLQYLKLQGPYCQM